MIESLTIEPSKSKIAVLGYGIEGRATLDYLKDEGASQVFLLDSKPDLTLEPAHERFVSGTIFGTDWLKALDNFDLIIKSPGIPLRIIPLDAHSRLTSATDIFLSVERDRTIGVTGTKGKSTTSSLISHILTCAGISNALGGNIGTPALSLLKSNSSTYVLELSSYQLELCTTSPHGSVLLNLFPEHLDHHGTLETYFAAKHKIHRFQRSGDFLVLPVSLMDTLPKPNSISASIREFGTPGSNAWIENGSIHYRTGAGRIFRLCETTELSIPGPGNEQNALAALCALSHYEISPSLMKESLCSFKPLPHRLQPVTSPERIIFVNDSISTIPESAINAITTYKGLVHTLILGGFDRGVSFDDLVAHVLKSNIRVVLLLPPSGKRLESVFRSSSILDPSKVEILPIPSMEEAVALAKQKTPEGSICLLSPAAPSYTVFRNFEERGNRFLELALSTFTRTPHEPPDKG